MSSECRAPFCPVNTHSAPLLTLLCMDWYYVGSHLKIQIPRRYQRYTVSTQLVAATLGPARHWNYDHDSIPPLETEEASLHLNCAQNTCHLVWNVMTSAVVLPRPHVWRWPGRPVGMEASLTRGR